MRAYERLQAARAKGRPGALACISSLFTDFYELHGDRLFGEDAAVVGGLARLGGRAVTVIGIEKGATTDEKLLRNFGSAHPEGYRKALRLMKQAEKFRRPVVTLVDTSGAYCGIGAEERGQGSAIAQNLMEMMRLSVPVIAIVLGEGGSGGALALAVADEVWLLENAVYSVISAEGAASILYKDASKAEKAAEDLKITAQDLLSLGVIDRIVSEQGGDFALCFAGLQAALAERLSALCALPPEALLAARYAKFRMLGRPER
ncbi:MAG: acetyl-CoA carboxylase carboxyltransferase subunit alpha [Christensenellaceae bacterium]|jgi:acetyl-CoA carboxylase carboxyl transferase subunit alpha|nr:acetyl-CoA carboxylase carboxyltransferase subunit alpha [Christensenellaceae bacterium]